MGQVNDDVIPDWIGHPCILGPNPRMTGFFWKE